MMKLLPTILAVFLIVSPGYAADPATACNSNSFGGKTSTMILARVTVENVDRFLEVFSTKVAAKRALYGSKGATVFRDPTEENRVWGLFDMGQTGAGQF